MKRLLILLLFAFPCFAARDFSGAYRHPNIPEAKEVTLDPPQTTNTFCAANLVCTVTATWSFTNLTVGGTATAKQINGSSVVDANCLTNWGNADLGACINAAYAAGPASGVDILVSPTPNGNGSGCTNFSTPIVFNTLHKVAFLHGPPGQIVCLNYTPTTGTAITFDYGNTLTGNAGLGPGYGHGMYGILINGPSASGSVVGLAIGTTNGSEGLSFESGGIMNVGTAITFGGGINFFQKFKHFVIGPTNLAFNLTVSIENVTFEHVKFECSFSGPTSACIQFTNSSGLTDVNFTQSSLHNSDVSINSSCGATCVRVAFNESHIEVTAASTVDLVNVQGGTLSIHQTEMNYGPASGPPSELITCNTGNCSLSLAGNYYGAGTAITNGVVHLTNGGKVTDLGDIFVSPNLTNSGAASPIISDGNTGQVLVLIPANGAHYNLPKIIYDTQSAAVNTNISTVTMATQGTGLAVSNTYRVSFYAAVVTPGTSCTGNTTVNLNFLYTDPNGTGQQTLAVTLAVATGNNGTAGNIIFSTASGIPQLPTWVFNAKAGSTIQWSTTSFTAGTGCSPAPTYQITPRLETM